MRFRPYGRSKQLSAFNRQQSLQPTKKKQWKVPGSTSTGTAGSAAYSNTGRLLSSASDGLLTIDHSTSLNTSTDIHNVLPLNTIGRNNVINRSSDNMIDDIRTRRISELSSQYAHYVNALHNQHLTVVPVSGDGNCLFRAVAHQVYGDERYHMLVREKCMDYMEVEADFFSQFVVGGRDMFPLYLQAKRGDACWGDDPEIEVSL